MKKLQNLSCLVFTILLLASCEKKESEENKPAEQIPEEIVDPGPDKIRKVIRYNNAGTIQDSILFRYDNKNQLTKIEYGGFVNGKFQKKIEYSYSTGQNGSNSVNEKYYKLNNSGSFDLIEQANYATGTGFKNTRSIKVGITSTANRSYAISYDSIGLLKYITQTGVKKNQDYYLDYSFQAKNGNIVSVLPDSYPGAGKSCTYTYYSQSYNHDLNFLVLEYPYVYFWTEEFVNLFDNRHRFMGNRNPNLLKNMKIPNSGYPLTFTETNYEYEFNTLGLVSKINTSTTTATGTTAPKGKNKSTAGSFPHVTPHTFKVPPGHYPPAGTYRIWYPGRPPGHQPAPVAYGYPPNAPITDGAFIIHGNQAYDTQYDWRKEEAKKPKSVPREIIDILFPNNTLPANN